MSLISTGVADEDWVTVLPGRVTVTVRPGRVIVRVVAAPGFCVIAAPAGTANRSDANGQEPRASARRPLRPSSDG